jgi:hypothetical protein
LRKEPVPEPRAALREPPVPVCKNRTPPRLILSTPPEVSWVRTGPELISSIYVWNQNRELTILIQNQLNTYFYSNIVNKILVAFSTQKLLQLHHYKHQHLGFIFFINH